MITPIKEKLPNPDASDPQGKAFDDYIKRTGIETCTEPALTHYQGTDATDGRYLDAEHLNHSLTLLKHGENSQYSDDAENLYGSELDDWDYDLSLQDMEAIFSRGGYSFSVDSEVYKGVRTSYPFYEIHHLDQCQPGEKIIFPGYVSTTVSVSKVKDFVSNEKGILLIISSLENAHCIVPDNSAIRSAKNSSTPEQEILLNKGTAFKVLDVDKSQSVIKIRCSVTK